MLDNGRGLSSDFRIIPRPTRDQLKGYCGLVQIGGNRLETWRSFSARLAVPPAATISESTAPGKAKLFILRSVIKPKAGQSINDLPESAQELVVGIARFGEEEESFVDSAAAAFDNGPRG